MASLRRITLQFPQSFLDMLGQYYEYRMNKVVKYSGIVIGLQWVDTYILHTISKKSYLGISIGIKTDEGKIIWTSAFNSELEIKN